jgi:aldose 1-epimerase
VSRYGTSISREPFGLLADGRLVERYTLARDNCIEISVLTYGGIIQSLRVPDWLGNRANVVLGFESLEGYRFADNAYFGAIVGRYANRIANGSFLLAGRAHQLSRNEGGNHLHGGFAGFDKQLWRARTREAASPALVLWLSSRSGDEGYPGAVEVEVTYSLEGSGLLQIEYRAVASQSTIINLTNHALFNLSGEGGGAVLGHELEINADYFTPVDDELIPTGEIAHVAGTPFDFRAPTRLESGIDCDHEQIVKAGGYDHNFVLKAREGSGVRRAARLTESLSGRSLEISTTEPGLQLYTGNRLTGSFRGSCGVPYERFAGVALETQRFPDSPNQPGFPSVILQPGEEYRSVTRLAFSSA